MIDELRPKHATSDGTVLAVGDCFYYRGKGSESAAVHAVIVRTLDEQIAGLTTISMFESGYEDAAPQPNLYVQISRIEVVQRREPMREPPPDPPAPPPLPKQFLKAAKKRKQ